MKKTNEKLFAIAFVIVLANRLIGIILMPVMLTAAPITFIFLSPTIFNLSIVSSYTSVGPFYVVAILASMLQCTIGYSFGRIYGIRATRWYARRKPRQAKKISILKKIISTAFIPVFLLLPGPIMSMVSGTVPVSRKLFFSIALVAQVLWVMLCRVMGASLQDIIIKHKSYSIWLTLLLVLLYTLSKIIDKRRKN